MAPSGPCTPIVGRSGTARAHRRPAACTTPSSRRDSVPSPRDCIVVAWGRRSAQRRHQVQWSLEAHTIVDGCPLPPSHTNRVPATLPTGGSSSSATLTHRRWWDLGAQASACGRSRLPRQWGWGAPPAADDHGDGWGWRKKRKRAADAGRREIPKLGARREGLP